MGNPGYSLQDEELVRRVSMVTHTSRFEFFLFFMVRATVKIIQSSPSVVSCYNEVLETYHYTHPSSVAACISVVTYYLLHCVTFSNFMYDFFFLFDTEIHQQVPNNNVAWLDSSWFSAQGLVVCQHTGRCPAILTPSATTQIAALCTCPT